MRCGRRSRRGRDRRPGESRPFSRSGGIILGPVSADNEGKSETPAAGAKPGAKTVVGVPALQSAPPDRPSDLEMTRQLPPKEAEDAELEASEAGTALDVKALSSAEAERVLAWTGFTQEEISTAHAGTPPKAAPSPRPPGVAGALPKAAPRPTTAMKTLPPSADMFVGLGRMTGGAQAEPEKPTRPGVPGQAGMSIKGGRRSCSTRRRRR